MGGAGAPVPLSERSTVALSVSWSRRARFSVRGPSRTGGTSGKGARWHRSSLLEGVLGLMSSESPHARHDRHATLLWSCMRDLRVDLAAVWAITARIRPNILQLWVIPRTESQPPSNQFGSGQTCFYSMFGHTSPVDRSFQNRSI